MSQFLTCFLLYLFLGLLHHETECHNWNDGMLLLMCICIYFLLKTSFSYLIKWLWKWCQVSYVLCSFICSFSSQSPGQSLPTSILMLQWSRPRGIAVFTGNWRKICVRSLDLMLCVSSLTGTLLCLVIVQKTSHWQMRIICEVVKTI